MVSVVLIVVVVVVVVVLNLTDEDFEQFAAVDADDVVAEVKSAN